MTLVLNVHFQTEEKGLGSQFITQQLLSSVWRGTLGFKKKNNIFPPLRKKPQSPEEEKQPRESLGGTGLRL